MRENYEDSWTDEPAEAGVFQGWRERLVCEVPKDLLEHLELGPIAIKVSASQRLSIKDGLTMSSCTDYPALARLAHISKSARFGEQVFFNRNLHVNQTNICVLACRFCAFRRGPKSDGAYALSVEEYISRVAPFSEHIDEVHSVGGLHPDWGIDYYESLFREFKQQFPRLMLKALTAVEIQHLSRQEDITVSEVLERLKSSGLDCLPGGGAEILDDAVRDVICRGKETSSEYIDIHRTAHNLGIPTNCTMLFGTIETAEQRIIHLDKLRTLQDETGGFQCFVPYPFLPDASRLPDAQLASSAETLRVIAISRLMLDNIPHIKAYRMNIGDSVAAMALNGGADDLDGTVGQEEIMHLAGSDTSLSTTGSELARLIEDSGGIPIERDTIYSRFRRHQPPPPSSGRRLPVTAE
ncbi:MAG TPA: CofH family radical SAM protein [Candidatus Poseidoniales archaeon]|nr:MAG: aminofutalosine synthase MqnE [Euryarchaeota archaeon]HIA24636.1 CofH family radical SAM protein [Candidatus Poseidoniales archaeon]HIO94973.1 CofH family radical SAM protein [Candidatus Poseidoniales archaeon]